MTSAEGATVSSGGRAVGFVDFGPPDGAPVVWCHGGPGSRLEPSVFAPDAHDSGLRMIGIDRPGYGLSALDPGRTIGGWVPDALAVVDHLGIAEFMALGVSTGGAYALALAALAPERVVGVVACCAMTDMRWEPARSLMDPAAALPVWAAADRAAAVAVVTDAFGADGSKLLERDTPLAPADLALLADPAFLDAYAASMPAQFANGVYGYTDDRLADGPGWITFDTGSVACPVTVLHGDADTVVDVINAEHTASVVPHAQLRIVAGLGHLSIVSHAIAALLDLLGQRDG